MSGFVPASTAIRRARVANIDTDRLQRRRDFLSSLIARPRDFEARMDFVVRVAELVAIERELSTRGIPIEEV